MEKTIKRARDIKIIASEDDIYLEDEGNGDGFHVLKTSTYIIACYGITSKILTLVQYFKRKDNSLENIYWLELYTTYNYTSDFEAVFDYICNVAQRMISIFENNVKKHALTIPMETAPPDMRREQMELF